MYGFMPFPKALAQSETQADSSQITFLTRITVTLRAPLGHR